MNICYMVTIVYLFFCPLNCILILTQTFHFVQLHYIEMTKELRNLKHIPERIIRYSKLKYVIHMSLHIEK